MHRATTELFATSELWAKRIEGWTMVDGRPEDLRFGKVTRTKNGDWSYWVLYENW